MEQWLFATFGAGLALLGSVVQSWMSWGQSNSIRRVELLVDAYSDYLNGIAQRASILTRHSERTEAATALMVSGKQKISAYAPANVVRALGVLERTPMSLSDKATQAAMVGLVLAMRKSIGMRNTALDEDIRAILFSAEVI